MSTHENATIGPIPGSHYVVMRYDGTCVYRGRFETSAAIALEPGTVFGRGTNHKKAHAAARARASEFVLTRQEGNK